MYDMAFGYIFSIKILIRLFNFPSVCTFYTKRIIIFTYNIVFTNRLFFSQLKY